MNFFENILLRIAALFVFLGAAALGVLVAQTPQGIPTETEPIDLGSNTEVIMYIVLPVIFVLLFFGVRALRKNKEESEA